MIDEGVAYFSTPGPTGDLGRFSQRVADLPAEPARLAELVRGLLQHNIDAESAGGTIPTRRDGMTTYGAEPTLARIVQLDEASLDEARPADERLVGFCYHFALLHCSLLRSKGTAARTRCGFASYLIPGKWTDHWVVEHWDDRGWRMIDAQVGLDDVSPDNFRTGVDAWSRCRAGEANPFDHGNGELWGWDELRGSLVNDLGALNKIEIGDWAWCQSLHVEPLDQPDDRLDSELDRWAALAVPGWPLSELQTAFLDDQTIHPPDPVIRAAASLYPQRRGLTPGVAGKEI